jgi:hypothetical protein
MGSDALFHLFIGGQSRGDIADVASTFACHLNGECRLARAGAAGEEDQ